MGFARRQRRRRITTPAPNLSEAIRRLVTTACKETNCGCCGHYGAPGRRPLSREVGGPLHHADIWIAQPTVKPAGRISVGIAAPNSQGQWLGDDNGIVALPTAAEKWLACALDGALAGWSGVS